MEELRDNYISKFRLIEKRDMARAVNNLNRRTRLWHHEKGLHFEHLLYFWIHLWLTFQIDIFPFVNIIKFYVIYSIIVTS